MVNKVHPESKWSHRTILPNGAVDINEEIALFM